MPQSALRRNPLVGLLLISAVARLIAWHADCNPGVCAPLRSGERIIFAQASSDAEGARLKLAASQQLFSYWTELRGARVAPERNDIDPAAIRGVLADTFILEFNPTAGFPVRISGSRTNSLFLRELRGESFLDLWRPQDRAEADQILAAVANEAQPFLIGAVGGPPGVETTDVEVLLLPLRHHGATHSRMLGACAPRSLSRWLGLLPIGTLALTSLRALGPGERNVVAATTRDFLRQANFRRRGHLFVYSSGSG